MSPPPLPNGRLKNVPIASLRCNIKPIAELQGFSGRPIEAFPPYRAFDLYLRDPEGGRRLFAEWFRKELFEREVWRHSKQDGGMATGSLQRTVTEIQRQQGVPETSLGEAPRAIVETAIERRVAYYFGLLESIRTNGFDASRGPHIRCWPKAGSYVLINGHHRTAALHALRYDKVQVEVRHLHRLATGLAKWRRRLSSVVKR